MEKANGGCGIGSVSNGNVGVIKGNPNVKPNVSGVETTVGTGKGGSNKGSSPAVGTKKML